MKSIYQNQNIVGCDETGVGDYLTPLVAAAVWVPARNVATLTALRVTDSKQLSSQKINALAAQIKPLVKFRVKHLTQSGYNKLNRNFNAHELKMLLHLSGINDLMQLKLPIDRIIIDQFSTKQALAKYYTRLLDANFNLQKVTSPITWVYRGEMEHVAVAAASILARASLLAMMKKQDQTWNMHFPLGTNQIVEKAAQDFVIAHGKNALGQVAKLKFKTTAKIID